MELVPVEVVSKVVEVLDRLGIPYVLGGSTASSVHGAPRATNDMDLVADVRSEHVQPLAEALQDEFYVEPTAIRDAIRSQGSFNLIHFETSVKVDVFIRGGDAFRGAQLARRQVEAVEDAAFQVLSPEDVILFHGWRSAPVRLEGEGAAAAAYIGEQEAVVVVGNLTGEARRVRGSLEPRELHGGTAAGWRGRRPREDSAEGAERSKA